MNRGQLRFPSPDTLAADLFALRSVVAPLPRSGAVFNNCPSGADNANSAGPSLNQMQYTPIVLAEGYLSVIGNYTTSTNTAGELLRLGIYADDPDNPATGPNRPGQLLLDAGTVNLASGTGYMNITINFKIPRLGLYWLTACRQGPSTTTVIATCNATRIFRPYAGAFATTNAQNFFTTHWTQDSVTGTFPQIASGLTERSNVTYPLLNVVYK